MNITNNQIPAQMTHPCQSNIHKNSSRLYHLTDDKILPKERQSKFTKPGDDAWHSSCRNNKVRSLNSINKIFRRSVPMTKSNSHVKSSFGTVRPKKDLNKKYKNPIQQDPFHT